jgi:Tol biopolymer transport system component
MAKARWNNAGIILLIGFLLFAGLFPVVLYVSGKKVDLQEDKFQETCPVTKNDLGGIYLSLEYCTNFEWSPDGTRIVFTSLRCRTHDIYVVDADGQNLKRLTRNMRATHPVWSPDGEKVAFSASLSGNSGIFVMNVDGSDLKRLTRDSDSDSVLKWSPNGKIIFLRRKELIYGLFTINADGTNQEQVGDLSGYEDRGSLALSPDGKRIAFSAYDNEWDIFVIEVDGGNLKRLTNDSNFYTSPAWSPDGEKIVFGSRKDNGECGTYIMNADGTHLTKICDKFQQGFDLAWAPDGNMIAISLCENRDYEISVVSAVGGTVHRLTEGNAMNRCPAWSPDGEKIAFTSSRDRALDVIAMNSDGSNQINVSHTPEEWWSQRYCIENVPWDYWGYFAGSMIIFGFVYFRVAKSYTNRKIGIGLQSGIISGILIVVIMQVEPLCGLEIVSDAFMWILLIISASPGILNIYFGGDVIDSTSDLVTSAAVSGTVFSLSFVFAMILSDISSGKYPFRNDPSEDILTFLLLFVSIFIIALIMSIGSGSLFAQHVIRRPVPKE